MYVAGFGQNDQTQLAAGVKTYRQPVPLGSVQFGDEVKAVGAGYFDSQVLTSKGVLLGQGGNGTGQLGDGTRTDKHAPVEILSDVKQFAKSGTHTIALLDTGEVAAWGGNAFGQEGDGTDGEGKDGVAAALSPKILPIEGAVAVYAGGANCLVLLADGTLLIWGSANKDQLGNGERRKAQNTPFAIPGVTGVVQASIAGTANFSGRVAALLSDGRVLEWGDGIERPTDVGLERIIRVVCAPGRTYAVDDQWRLWLIRGDNKRGRLGIPGLPESAIITTPTLIDVPGIVDVEGGTNTTLARTVTGDLYTCGENTNGEAGDGSTIDKLNGLTRVERLGGGVIDFASGEHHSMVVCREALPLPLLRATSIPGGFRVDWTVASTEPINALWQLSYKAGSAGTLPWISAPQRTPPTEPASRSWEVTGLDPAPEYQVRVHNHDWHGGVSESVFVQPL